MTAREPDDLRDFADFGAAEAGGPTGAFGGYRISRELGRGGMGVVYDAFEEAMERRVALKILPAGLMVDQKSVVRFQREARIVGRLKHANIVSVYATGAHEKTPYIAMEFVEGETLDRILERKQATSPEDSRGLASKILSGVTKALSARTTTEAAAPPSGDGPQEAAVGKDREESWSPIPSTTGGMDLSYCIRTAKTFAAVADGLQHAHLKGVVHRDLKPSNLILDPEGRIRILDFGLARLEGQQSLTGTGEIVGTPRYMSPEQARAKQVTIDHRTDIYSLGATLYEMLTLTPPFQGRTAQETLSQIIQREPRPLRQLNPRVPRDLETIVLRCLRKNPADRYSTAEAFARDLERFVRGDPIEARPQGLAEKLARRIRQNKGKCAAAAVILLLLCGTGWFAYENARKSRLMKIAAYDDRIIDAAVVLQTTGTLHEFVGKFTWGGAGYDVSLLTESLGWEGPTQETFAKAVRSLEDAIRDVPERSEAYYLLARALLIDARRDRAAEVLGRAIERRSIPAMVLQATILERKGEKGEAAALLSRARSSTESAWADAWLAANRAMDDRDWRRAVDAYEQLIALEKKGSAPYPGSDVENHLACGIAALQLNQDDEARGYFKVASVLRPQAMEPELLLGLTYHRQGDEAKAEEIFEKLHREADDPDEAANYMVTLNLFRFGDYEEALLWAERMRPGFFRELWRAQCLSLLGRTEEAVEAARRLPKMRPEAVLSYIVAAGSLIISGDYAEAEELSREACRIAPRSSVPYGLLANALHLQKKYGEAFQATKKAVEVEPDAGAPRFYLSLSYRGMGNLAAAAASLREALSLAPDVSGWSFDSAVAQSALGEVLEEMGKKEESLAAFRKAVELGVSRERRTKAPWLPQLARAQFAIGRAGDAVRTIEEALAHPQTAAEDLPRLQALYEECARAALPDLPTYRSVDFAVNSLDRAELVPVGAEWRYFEGTEAPSAGLDWTRVDYDDSRWKRGPSPFGYDLDRAQASELRTTIQGMRGKFTTLYIRRMFPVEDPGNLASAVLWMKADDGFVAYLNGEEVGRHLAPDEPVLPHDATAVRGAIEPLTSVKIPVPLSRLRPGPNILAIQGLNQGLDSSDFSLTPVLRARRQPDPESVRKLRRDFDGIERGPDAGGRRGYLEVRLLQREGKHVEALEYFEKRNVMDLSRPEPLLAYARSLRASGRASDIGKLLQDRCGAQKEIWDLWLAASMSDLGLTPEQIAADFPCEDAKGYARETRRHLGELTRGEALRINCGGERYESAEGVAWERDRLFVAESVYMGGRKAYDHDIPGTENDPLYQTARYFVPATHVRPGYRIPLPPGRYRLTLHFAEIVFRAPGRRVFDVIVEGETVLEKYEPFRGSPGTPDLQSREVTLRDGLLDIDFRWRVRNPIISAIEIERL